MVNKSELRIGSWLYHNEIKEDGTRSSFKISTGEEIDRADQFDPIPLSVEVLIGLGFKAEAMADKTFPFEVQYVYPIPNEFDEHMNFSIIYTPIPITGVDRFLHRGHLFHYVHQLQIIFYAVAGEELHFND